MAARHEEEDEEEERIVGMMEPQLKIRRTNPYVPDLDQNVNLPERPRKPRVTSTVSRPPPAVLDEDDEEDVGGQSDITDDRDQSYQPPPSDEEEEGANSSSEEEELEDSQQVEAETGEESMDASMVSESGM